MVIRRTMPAALMCVGMLLSVMAGSATPTAFARKTAPSVKPTIDPNAADNRVVVVVHLRVGRPHTVCKGTARLLRRSVHLPTVSLPRLRTGAKGGALWQWHAGDGVPAGRLQVKVRCKFPDGWRPGLATKAVQAGPHPDRRPRSLVGSPIRVRAWAPKSTQDGSGGGDNLYPFGQCTWYVAKKRPDLPYFAGKGGDAKNWIASAAKAGYIVGDRPRERAVAVFTPGQYHAGTYGHVAYVEQLVGADKIKISEANFDPRHLLHSTRTIEWDALQFIYFKRRSPEEIAPSQQQPTPPPVFSTLLASAATGQPGEASNNDSSAKALSDDARYVAFDSTASNLDFPADADLNQDVYLRDAQGGTTMLVSRTSTGAKANAPSWGPDISGDGRYVVFVSAATNLDAADTHPTTDVFVRDTRTGTTRLVSRADGVSGEGGDEDSSSPAISGDGRFVSFQSRATNLVAGAANGRTHVFVRDLEAGTTRLVSRVDGAAGAPGDGDSSDPAISHDGHLVVFESAASNLVAGDGGGRVDVFARDVNAGTTRLLSRAATATGEIGNGESTNPDISGSGQYVTFDSRASNLDPAADADTVGDVFVRDLEAGTITLVSRAGGASGAHADGASANPAISDDGRHISFESTATNLGSDDHDAERDVYERDLVDTPKTTLISRANGAGGAPDNQEAFAPAISDDGRTVVFTSYATNLDPADSDNGGDVFLRDGQINLTALVSRASGTVGLKDGSQHATISGDGRYVAFTSQASKLDPADDDKVSDVFVRDLQSGTTTLVSRADTPSGAKGNGDSWGPAISDDGRHVAFFSYSTNLDPGDSNEKTDVFVRDLQAGTTVLVSRGTGVAGVRGNGDSSGPAISRDGRYVSFESVATTLDPADPDPTMDVYVRDVQAATTTLVSRAASGAKGNDVSKGPAISGDGRLVSFTSSATTLDSSDPDTNWDVYVRDWQAGTTRLASRATSGAKGDSHAVGSAISASGRYVTFSSGASNLDPSADSDTTWDVFVRDLQAGTTTLVSRASNASGGAKGNSDSLVSSISGNERYVTFESTASNLAPEADGDTIQDVFVRDLQAGTTTLVSRATGSPGVKGNGNSERPDISDGGRYVAFTSVASDLDGDEVSDVFVRDVLGDPATSPPSSISAQPAQTDKTAPKAKLSGARSQKLGAGIRVTVSCPGENCRAIASGSILVPRSGSHKATTLRLKAPKRSVRKGKKTPITLKLSAKARVAIKRALKAGKPVVARLTVRVSDTAGNGRNLTYKVKLKL
jgi:surface antigen